ncbi:MAG: hypothetical protein O7G85_00750 [Planctomycetota bacterium]|nr:hypothetical protein [Planctomycetota bacterium]
MFYVNQTLAQGTRFDGQAMEALSGLFSRMDILNHPQELLDSLAQIPLVLAGIFLVVGLMCVLNGYNWHKWIVVVLAFMGGIVLGNMLGDKVGNSTVIAFAIGALFAIIATPMLKITVAIFGGLTGAFIGANLWTALNAAQPEAHWAGAALGFVIIGMTSFILFKLVIVFFTSIGGAAMIVLGTITLLLQVDGWEATIRDSLANNDKLIPILVGLAAITGFVLQQSKMQSGKNEEAEPAT